MLTPISTNCVVACLFKGKDASVDIILQYYNVQDNQSDHGGSETETAQEDAGKAKLPESPLGANMQLPLVQFR